MPTDHRERLTGIRRFDQLVAYLRDELGWPIDSDDFEELTFEYTPEELGIDAKNAAKIQEIKRLRPLAPSQPWGIFFVKFEPKRLPVVALRRILGQVTLKKRASANESERQAWAADDLLFVSNYGEGEERRIAFAHFSKPQDAHDLPTLKVLGWDNLDTPLHLGAVARELTDHLTWPDDEDDPDAWRERWRGAFKLRHREVITTSKELSERLAELARAIRDRIRTGLVIETESGPLTKLMKAFQTALVHDLNERSFADMYAQTIAYGLLSARITDPARRTADDFAAHMRTNPFLRELMQTFLRLGGRRGKAGGLVGIDFDELGITEVVEFLDQANMEAVVRDFGDRNPQEDPVIHFYEHFLAAYDKKQKVSRGVFYTPRPVVSYIVRSVDELLRSEFGLTDGLADISTWGQMAKHHKELKIPAGTPPAQAFVQILDPATGTGTFLVEVIDLIHRTMVEKWTDQGLGERQIDERWNDYVPKDLLPRLHGYELLMAPYAIAHLKIGLKLYETGYRFESEQRAQVYLTNALEPWGNAQMTFDFLPALAHEAQAVNEIKRCQRFTVVIGNPPYSGHSANTGEWIERLIDTYYFVDGQPLGEANSKWLRDDYVKFIRLGQHLLTTTGCGAFSFITNHGYIDNPTFRGMRRAFSVDCHRIWISDLHGNTKKRETTGSGDPDDNVFDIQQGVAVFLAQRGLAGQSSISHGHVRAARTEKYELLWNSTLQTIATDPVLPGPELYLFVPQEIDIRREFDGFAQLNVPSVEKSLGVLTKRDALVIAFTQEELKAKIRKFTDTSISDAAISEEFRLPRADRDTWDLELARQFVDRVKSHQIRPIQYRPFDIRYIYYDDVLVARMNQRVLRHLEQVKGNRGLVLGRQGMATGAKEWDVCLVCAGFADQNVFRRGGGTVFPLRLAPSEQALGSEGLAINLAREVQKHFGRFDASPDEIMDYAYGLLHSPTYRSRYAECLKMEFPRLPMTLRAGLFRGLSQLGGELMDLHLLHSPKVEWSRTTFIGPRNPEVIRVGWSEGTVWIDAGRTSAREGHRATKAGSVGFRGVPAEVWDFHIGGYQVCHKWLKDRKGRRLSEGEIVQYQKVVVALVETIRIRTEIDEVIDAHGGWPAAFRTEAEHDARSVAQANVVPFRPPTVDPEPEDRYVTCIPLVPLRAAAGVFSDPQYIEEGSFEWVEIASRHRLREGMFVAQVVGKSMEPAVPDTAWCLFRAGVDGTREGKTVLVELRSATDPETGQRYTLKRYKSEKAGTDDGSWHHVKITLEPVNPDFEPIVLTGAEEGEIRVVAELVDVLQHEDFVDVD